MAKVIIADKTKIEIPETKEKLIVIGMKEESIPLELVQKLISNGAEFIYVKNGTVAEYAFEIGRLSVQEMISEIFTGRSELKDLIPSEGKQPKRKNKKTAKLVEAEEIEKTAAIVTERKNSSKKEAEGKAKNKEPKKAQKNETDNANTSEKTATAKKAEKRSAEKKNMPATYSSKTFNNVTEKQVEDILKRHKVDLIYKAPIMEALKIASDVTLDLIVRTKVALISEDKETCVKIGEIIKKELVG